MRILKAVVIVMGVLIFAGLGLLIWRMFTITSKDSGAPVIAHAPPAAMPTPFDRVALGLPEGCDIAGADAGDGRLVVRSSCGDLYVLDLATLRVLGVIGAR